MARTNDKKYDELLKDNQFLNWFQSKGHGNKLIQFLNKHTQKEHNDELRRERYPPFVYGLVLKILQTMEPAQEGMLLIKNLD